MAETRIFECGGQCEIGDLFRQRETPGAIADAAEQFVALVETDESAALGVQGGRSTMRAGAPALAAASQVGERVAGDVEKRFAIGGLERLGIMLRPWKNLATCRLSDTDDRLCRLAR